MKVSSYANRIGGFSALNSGIISNCYTDAFIKFKLNVAGFTYENTGTIKKSASQKKTIGKENIGGFCFRNKGSIVECGWLRKNAEQKKHHKIYSDHDLTIDYTKISELHEKLSLGSHWRSPQDNDTRLEFTDELYDITSILNGKEPVNISTAEELFKISRAIASGDNDAATRVYKLTKDINLKGKKWLPIGLSETNAFSGIFDGCGFKIYNFKINAKNLNHAGFFGYVQKAAVVNLKIDCVVNASGGNTTGAMCGTNDGGFFINCRVLAKVNAENCCGGFIGNNMGTIEKCCFIGKISPAIPVLIPFLPIILGALLLLILGLIALLLNLRESPYKPTVIDPNSKPVIDNTPVTPPPAGSSRISIECNQEVYVDSKTQVGIIEYVNPRRSTQDVEIHIKISDAELIRTIGRTGRTAEEQAQLESSGSYDAEKSFQVLYRSGRIEIGYMLELCQLSALPDGTTLPAGDYEMIVGIEAFDPETHEKAVVNAQAPITVHIIDPS